MFSESLTALQEILDEIQPPAVRATLAAFFERGLGLLPM